ncbi:MAG TPA: DUF4105 domain-containing protein [Kofleriaceae bacterium]|nr:DUF4105 domain-containing protein [Kofleriaceae bacterium]
MRWWSPVLVAVVMAPGAARAGEPGETAPTPAAGAEARPAGPPPVVELYTMGQGALIFEKFGHAALCVSRSTGRPRSICYNYGTTDFEALVPLFWGFLRGRSEFWVSRSGRGRMLSDYRDADRTLYRQLLPLAPDQARELDRLLRENAREENRYYRYHHYYDNCSTRVRDLIDRVTGGALSARRAPEHEHPTYRELSRTGYAGDTWLLLLSDLMLGRAADAPPRSDYEAMFLPDQLRAGVEARLGAVPTVMYEREGPPFPGDTGMGGRWLFALLALALAAPVAAARHVRRRERLAIAVAMVPVALIGVVLWIVAAATSLPELRWNEALLVFLPLDAALPFLPPLWRTRYAAARVAMLVLIALLLAVGLFRQPLWFVLLPPLLPMLLVALPRRAPAPAAAPPPVTAPAPPG